MENKNNIENSDENKSEIEFEKENKKENLEKDNLELEGEKIHIKISLVELIFIIMFISLLIVVGVAFTTIRNDNCTSNIQFYNNNENYFFSADKPIIYIYPEEETKVEIKLGRPELLTTTYPKYEEEGWQVIAKPDGTLKDCKTERELYALYWEGQNSKNYNKEIEEGFIISGEETAKFLEEKLEILGLNEREAEEFIVYWLPQMEDNKYNYIRFQTMEEIEENMPLEIIPAPETVIRVMMEWKALDEKIEIEEQQLEKVERKGYTVIEWGGTEIDFGKNLK